jgi:hypothetical protein
MVHMPDMVENRFAVTLIFMTDMLLVPNRKSVKVTEECKNY